MISLNRYDHVTDMNNLELAKHLKNVQILIEFKQASEDEINFLKSKEQKIKEVFNCSLMAFYTKAKSKKFGNLISV